MKIRDKMYKNFKFGQIICQKEEIIIDIIHRNFPKQNDDIFQTEQTQKVPSTGDKDKPMPKYII